MSVMNCSNLPKSTCLLPVTPKDPTAYTKPPLAKEAILAMRSPEVTLTKGIKAML